VMRRALARGVLALWGLLNWGICGLFIVHFWPYSAAVVGIGLVYTVAGAFALWCCEEVCNGR
jgi:hypothetical protein